MDEKYKEEIKDTILEARKIKETFNLESLDTALLILIQQDLDQIRFHNTD